MKRKSRDPYLKLYAWVAFDIGATFTDMDKQFRWLNYDEVVEL